AGRFRQAVQMDRPADTHLLVENESREVAHARELRSAACQYHAAPAHLVEAAGFQPGSHKLECFLQTRLHDSYEQRARDLLDMPLLLADLGNVDHFPLVRGSGNGMAVE